MNRVENVLEEVLRLHPEIAQRLRDERPRASIAAALVRVRNSLALTQRDIAAMMDTPQSNVARLEKPAGNPQTTESLVAYAKACGLTLGLVFMRPTDNGVEILEATGIDEDGLSDEFLRRLITVTPVVRENNLEVAAAYKAAACS